MSQIRYHNLDFLKVLAALFITNSHFIPLYKDVSSSLATLGVHGNALFFFVSGFLLMMGFEKKKERFDNWYKKRIQRLWPAVFLWGIIAVIVWSSPISWQDLLIAKQYWFLQCIAIYYILYYSLGNININAIGGGKIYRLKIAFILSIAASLIYFFLFLPKAAGSIFHTNLHFICHFSILVMGGLTYCYKDKICLQSIYKDGMHSVIWFVAYFIILHIGKGRDDYRYYLQIAGLVPLHLFVFYIYKTCSYPWCQKLFNTRGWKWIFILISNLTLEIYIVQFHIITDKFNALFPLNTVIVFILICTAAYVLRVITSFFLQFLSATPFEWKEMVQVK